MDVLQSFLDDFYDSTEQGGFTSYSRSDQRKTLLLMHILVVGLALEGYNMGPRQCDLLRQGLKAHPMLFTSLYRHISPSGLPLLCRDSAQSCPEVAIVSFTAILYDPSHGNRYYALHSLKVGV